jgi:hypothetical protein
MVLNMAQTWHQVRPGEVRNDCGGCHSHSQKPTSFELTAAAKPDYKLWDLTKEAPLFTTKANDKTGKQWDKASKTGVHFAKGVKDVEFYRDIKPLLEKSCVACHTKEADKPAGNLVLNDYQPWGRRGLVPWAENVTCPEVLPHTYVRLAQYSWAFQSRRSPLMWKVHGERLDGFANEDVESPKLNYHDDKDVLNWCHHSRRFQWDVDYTGTAMPPPDAIAGTYKGEKGMSIKVPPLSDEDKVTLARWIDIGCPIDLDFDPARPEVRGRGWMLDEGRPTLALASPLPGDNQEPLSRIIVGMHDYATGLNPDSFNVTADFAIDGVAAGENLASRFKPASDGVWELKLEKPIADLRGGKLTVSVEDREGNVTRVERSFSVAPK